MQERQPPLWPQSEAVEWSLRHALSHDHDELAALALLEPADGVSHAAIAAAAGLDDSAATITSSRLLGAELADFAAGGMLRILATLGLATLLMLRLALGSWRDTALALCSLALTATLLLGSMSALRIEWNFLNLGASLLLLGTSIDFSIHLLRAMRDGSQPLHAVRQRVGNALLVCALTTIAGFASIGFADNRGLAGLGQVCALGHAANLLASLYVLPILHRLAGRGARSIPLA